MTDNVYVQRLPSQDPRLGRHIVHDERSRAFALPVAVDRLTWRTRLLRVWDPVPNPNQVIGDCTGCAKMMQFNAEGNRVKGRVLGIKTADQVYSLATTLDPFPGTWPPEDSGSSGLAAAKAAQRLGLGGEYRWIFNGADGVVQAVVEGSLVNVGTRWYETMFDPDGRRFITPGGAVVGGHEYAVRGYSKEMDAVRIRCWWGSFRDVWMKRAHLADLLADDGDALVQKRA